LCELTGPHGGDVCARRASGPGTRVASSAAQVRTEGRAMGSAKGWVVSVCVPLLLAAALFRCGVQGPELAAHVPLVAPVDLYVVHRGTGDEPPRLSAFRVDGSSGGLTPIGQALTLPPGERAHEVVVDPANLFVFVATRHDEPREGGAASVRGLVYGFR